MNNLSNIIFLLIFSTMVFPSIALAQVLSCEESLSDVSSPASQSKIMRDISLISLVAVPNQYDEQRISVAGVFELYYDRMAFFVSKDHFQANEVSSMVWAELPQCITPENMEEMATWVGRFVRVEGTFNASAKNFAAGTIQSIEKVEVWYSGR